MYAISRAGVILIVIMFTACGIFETDEVRNRLALEQPDQFVTWPLELPDCRFYAARVERLTQVQNKKAPSLIGKIDDAEALTVIFRGSTDVGYPAPVDGWLWIERHSPRRAGLVPMKDCTLLIEVKFQQQKLVLGSTGKGRVSISVVEEEEGQSWIVHLEAEMFQLEPGQTENYVSGKISSDKQGEFKVSGTLTAVNADRIN